MTSARDIERGENKHSKGEKIKTKQTNQTKKPPASARSVPYLESHPSLYFVI